MALMQSRDVSGGKVVNLKGILLILELKGWSEAS